MRVVVQRVNHARVIMEGIQYSKIGCGLCIFLGVELGADENDIEWLINKVINLRIFNDDKGKMNLSLQDVEGEILLVSQFTLHASTKKGNRPSFIQAEKPHRAESLYNRCIELMEQKMEKPIQTGVFGGDMKVELENDGPVTIIIDTELKW